MPSEREIGELYVTKTYFSSEVSVLLFFCPDSTFFGLQCQPAMRLLSECRPASWIINAHPEDRAMLESNSSAEVGG